MNGTSQTSPLETELRNESGQPVFVPLEVAVSSEKGHREENQDWLSWIEGPRGELFVVADGMGGYKGGARAAKMTVDSVERHVNAAPPDWPFSRALSEAIRLTNEEVHRAAHSGDPETENMGSTVVVALVSDGFVQVGHVGDSRAYLYRKGQLRRLTKDHTKVQQMVDAGMITPQEARTHPDSHILNRAIGSQLEVEVEIGQSVRLLEGDGLLLCSDGLSGFVQDKDIRQVLDKQPNVQRVPDDLVELALAAGSDDNITVQFVRFGKPIRDRATAPLPRMTMAPKPVQQVVAGISGIRMPAISKRRAAWVAALTLLIAAAAAIPFLLAAPPPVQLRILLESPAPGKTLILQWTAPDARDLVTQPEMGSVITPLTRLTVRQEVPVPVDGPQSYKAIARTTRLMLWTVQSELGVTIEPRAEAALPGKESVEEKKPPAEEQATGSKASETGPVKSAAGRTPTPAQVPTAGKGTPALPGRQDQPTPAAGPPQASEPTPKEQPEAEPKEAPKEEPKEEQRSGEPGEAAGS